MESITGEYPKDIIFLQGLPKGFMGSIDVMIGIQ
jgi:hypothetical protein